MSADYNLYLVVLAVILCLLSLFLFFLVLSLGQKLKKSSTDQPDSVLLESLPIPVFVKGTDGRYGYVNRAFEEFFETRRERIVGKKPKDILSRQDAEFVALQDFQLPDSGGGRTFESYLTTVGGETYNLLLRKKTLAAPDGSIAGVAGVIFDATHIAEYQSKLEDQRSMFLSVVENTPDIVIRYDEQGRRTYVNPAFIKFMGLAEEQLVGSSHFPMWRGSLSAEAYAERIRNVLTGGENSVFEMKWTDAQNQPHIYEVTLVPEKNRDGEIKGVFVLAHDITLLKQIEMHYRNLTDNWPEEIACFDLDCRRTYVNPSMKKSLMRRGGDLSELIGTKPIEFLRGKPEAVEFENKLKETMETGQIIDFEKEWPYDDESGFRHIRMVPEYNMFGELSGVFTIAKNITVEKRAELERQQNLLFFESLDRFNRSVQHSNDVDQVMHDGLGALLRIFDCDRAFLVSPLDPDADFCTIEMQRCNAARKVEELTREAIAVDDVLRRMTELLLASDKPLHFGCGSPLDLAAKWFQVHRVSELAVGLYPRVGEPWKLVLHQCDSARVWNEFEVRLFDEIGKRFCDALTATLTYRNLQNSEKFLDNIIDNIPLTLFVKDAEQLRFVRINKAGEQLLGYAEGEILGKNDQDIFPQEQAEHFRQIDRQVLTGQQKVAVSEEAMTDRGNRQRILLTKKIAITDKRGQPEFLLGISEDITELKESQKTIHKFTQAILQSPSLFVLLTPDGVVEFVNQKYTDLHAVPYSDVVGRPVTKISGLEISDALFGSIKEAIRVQGIWRSERSRDEGKIWELLQVSPIYAGGPADQVISHYILTINDISDQKTLEDQLYQSQKMEAVGQLAGGIAHDFNNMLGVILGRTDLLLHGVGAESPQLESIREIRNAAIRSAELTRQLLAFARKETVSPVVVDLNSSVENSLKMLRRLIGEDISLKWLPAEPLWPVKIDPSQLDQVLANLCVNARDAISGVGVITIETGNLSIDASYARIHADFTPGDFVQLSVSDSGCGMSPQQLNRIFDPFYTTKRQGEGTGLGLSTVYGIVKQNGGFINVYSEPGHGSHFRIYLPRSTDERVAVAEAGFAAQIPRGQETILLVEDDETILETEKEMLEILEYQVHAAATPGEALRIAEQLAGDIQLMITDVIMPEMNGRELALQIKEKYPHISILFMSGYTNDIIASNGILEENTCFIQKPYSLGTLAEKVREALDSKSCSVPL